MELDDEVCLCFHVTKRKLLAHMRINQTRMRRPSQLSECGGAGTGCGWCVRYLKRLFAQQFPNPQGADSDALLAEPTSDEHQGGRRVYLQERQKPPEGPVADSPE